MQSNGSNFTRLVAVDFRMAYATAIYQIDCFNLEKTHAAGLATKDDEGICSERHVFITIKQSIKSVAD